MKFRELGQVSERPKVNAFYQLTTYKRPVAGSDRVFVAEDADYDLRSGTHRKLLDGVQVLRGMYMHPDHVRTRHRKAAYWLAIEPDPLASNRVISAYPGITYFDFYGRAGFQVVEPQ